MSKKPTTKKKLNKPFIPIGHEIPAEHGVLYSEPPKGEQDGIWDLRYLPEWGRLDIWEHENEKDYFIWGHTKEEWLSNECITFTDSDGLLDGMYFGFGFTLWVYDLNKAIKLICTEYADRFNGLLWKFRGGLNDNNDFYTIQDKLEEQNNLFAVSFGWPGWRHGSSGSGLGLMLRDKRN